MRMILFICLTLISSLALATVYRWVDSNGQVHYSDKPRENAEVVELKENTHNKMYVPVVKTPASSLPSVEDNVTYNLTISSPTEEQTIRNNSGDFSIVSHIAPKPPKAALYSLEMDGTQIGEAQQSGLFNLNNIDRGEHQFVVNLLTQNGKVLASSPARTIYLHRARIGQGK